MINIGDWVQTTIEQTDPVLGLISVIGGIGHVVGEDSWDGAHAYVVTFERTGRTTICGEDELIRLCDYSGDPRVRTARSAS